MKKLVISDIHANPDALEAILSVSQGEYGGVVCLGDITGYGPDPEACIAILRSLGSRTASCVILAGNHDAVLYGAIPSEWFNKNAQASVIRTRHSLSRESLEWLSSLPSYADLGERALAVHGAPEEPVTGYLFGGMETFSALAYLTEHSYDFCLCGHTHSAAVYGRDRTSCIRAPVSGETVSLIPGPVIVNPGSVGFPRSFNGVSPRDEPIGIGSYPAYFGIWDSVAGTFTFREVRYDRTPLETRLAAF